MRALLISLLCLCLALTGCAGAPAEAPVELSAPAEPAPEATPAPSEAPDTQAPDAVAEADVQAMMPALDSIARAMGLESAISYSAEDGELVWSALYLMGADWGMLHPAAGMEEEGIIIPQAAMEELAAAAFGQMGELPPIPGEMAELISYEGEREAYILTPSVTDGIYTMIEHWAGEGEAVSVTLGMYDNDGVRLGGMVFTLGRSGYAAAEPVFAYSVLSVANEAELGLSRWREATEGGGIVLQSAGEKVAVSLKQGEDMAIELTFEHNGAELKAMVEYLALEGCYVGDTTPADGYTELYVIGDMGSEDYMTYVYRVAGGQIQAAAIEGRVESVSGNGMVQVSCMLNVLGSHVANCMYALDEGLQAVRQGDYSIRLHEGSWEDEVLTTVKGGLAITAQDGSDGQTWSSGERFLLAATDGESYAVLMAEDGGYYTIEIEPSPEGGWLIQGQPEGEWFEELNYAG